MQCFAAFLSFFTQFMGKLVITIANCEFKSACFMVCSKQIVHLRVYVLIVFETARRLNPWYLLRNSGKVAFPSWIRLSLEWFAYMIGKWALLWWIDPEDRLPTSPQSLWRVCFVALVLGFDWVCSSDVGSKCLNLYEVGWATEVKVAIVRLYRIWWTRIEQRASYPRL